MVSTCMQGSSSSWTPSPLPPAPPPLTLRLLAAVQVPPLPSPPLPFFSASAFLSPLALSALSPLAFSPVPPDAPPSPNALLSSDPKRPVKQLLWEFNAQRMLSKVVKGAHRRLSNDPTKMGEGET